MLNVVSKQPVPAGHWEEVVPVGPGLKVVLHVVGDEVEPHHTGPHDVEGEHDEEALVVEANADSGEVAVVVSLQDALLADGAVVCAVRHDLVTLGTVPSGQVILAYGRVRIRGKVVVVVH